MKRHNSKDAFYERLRNLAEVDKSSVKVPQTRNLGTLIDYKRAADGVAYGIIKENHRYFIKKAGLKQDPNVADFAYIGGLENITNFQYKSLAEADKQRNMLFATINEAVSLKPNKNGGKKVKLNEDKAGEEIEAAAEKVGDLDAATSAAAKESMAGLSDEEEMAAGLEAEPEGGEEEIAVDAEEPAPEGDEETPADEPEDGEEPAPEGDVEHKDLVTKEIEKFLGKLTNKIRGTELTNSQVKSYVNSFLAAFKDKFDDVEIEDRKAMADKILKVVPDEDIEDVNATVPQDGEPAAGVEEEVCAECGGFGVYAESRGYTKESLMECGEEEMANLVSGYANAYNDGMNDGDFKTIALIITPKIVEKLKCDYGHDEYAQKLTPYVDSLNECGLEEKQAQLDEFWSGLGQLGKAAVGGIKGAVQKGAEKVGQAAQAVKQTYYAGEKNAAIKKLQAIAADLGKQIADVNIKAQKAGEQPINVNSILQTIVNQVSRTGSADLSKFRTAESIDPANVEVQPGMVKEEDEPEEIGGGVEKKEIGFAPEGDVLGGGVVKPDGAGVTTVDVQKGSVQVTMNEEEKKPSAGLSKEKKSSVVKAAKAGKDIGKPGKGFKDVEKKAKESGAKDPKAVAAAAMWKNVKREGEEAQPVMSESEQKLRKYIRARLQEKAGFKKPTLTESAKSETLKKLDGIIDKQFELYESVVAKKKAETINEIFGLSIKEKFAKLDPNDAQGVTKLFVDAYRNILNNPKMGAIGNAARKTTIPQRYELLKQFVQGGGGTLRLTPDGTTVQYASQDVKNRAVQSMFTHGGTQGKTQFGGV